MPSTLKMSISSFLEHIPMTLYNNKILQIRLKILRSKSWAIQGSPIVDKGPHGEGRPCYNGDRERTEDTGLLALKLERGGMSQGL